MPAQPRPIVIIGAGGVVRTAHLPVYQRLNFPVAGLYDINPDASRETARRFGVSTVFSSLAEAAGAADAVFDVAVPGDQIAGVLKDLPRGSAVLIQKPMGEDLDAARSILAICRELGLVAAMNFQLRFSPNVLALRDLLAARELGEIVDIEVRLVVKQPWHLWKFLEQAPRLEILYHSIHYLDMIRALAGEPCGVYCRAVAHPSMPEFQDTRSTDHSRLRERAALLAAAQSHLPAARGARCIVLEGRRHQRGGPADARGQHRLPERPA